MFISGYLSRHLQPSLPDKAKKRLEGSCSVCGCVGSHLLVDDVLDPSSGKLCEFMRYGDTLICENCTTLWTQPKVFHRSIFATDTRLAFPLIAPEGSIKKKAADKPMKRSALQDHPDRPLWRLLLRDTSWWDSQRVLAIVLHDLSRGISDCIEISLPRVAQCLDVVELAYSNGYSKAAIETGLLVGAKDIRQALEFEKMLAPYRGSNEFLLSVVVAQKDDRWTQQKVESFSPSQSFQGSLF
jgi:hypothetical protein